MFGLAGLGERAQAPPEVVTLADARVAARARATSPRPTGFVTRSRAAGGGAWDVASGYELVPRPGPATSSSGRNAVREVPAAGARCSSCGRASALPPHSSGLTRAHVRGCTGSASSPRRPAPPITRASSRGASRVPVRGRLGARCGGAAADLLPRPGDGPAEPRRRRPERGGRSRDRRRRPRAWRGERRDAGRVPGIQAVEHFPVAVVPNLARYLAGRQGRPPVGLCGRCRRRAAALGRRSRTAPPWSSARRERCPTARPADVRRDDLDPARAGSRINVSVAAAVALFEAKRSE